MKTFEEFRFKVKHSEISPEPIKTFRELREHDYMFYISKNSAIHDKIVFIDKVSGCKRIMLKSGEICTISKDEIDNTIQKSDKEVFTTDPNEANIAADEFGHQSIKEMNK